MDSLVRNIRNPPRKHQYEHWKKRNASCAFHSTISWNPRAQESKRRTPPIRPAAYSQPARNVSADRRPNSSVTNARKKPHFVSTKPAKNGAPIDDAKRCYCRNEEEDFFDRAESSSFDDDSALTDDDSSSSWSEDLDGIIYEAHERDLRRLRRFRDAYYFECHSVEERLAGERPAAHKCRHSFFLNDRLFAQPEYADHRNRSRCGECHLPLPNERSMANDKNNGKTKIGSADVFVRLPRGVPIVAQRASRSKNFDEKLLRNPYFTHDSLAMRYQKEFDEKYDI